MTKEVKNLLDKIKNNKLFYEHSLYFVGGTALSTYLNHRVSYDIDIASSELLPISAIQSFAYELNAKAIVDKNASAFKINSGKDIKSFYMKFMVEGVKLEFSYFKSPIQESIIKNAKPKLYEDEATLKILDLNSIVKLKIFALFNRQKTRDLFDVSIILEENIINIKELERIYSFTQNSNKSILEYIELFSSKDDIHDENSLDFLKKHKYYKIFAKLSQMKRFDKAKDMFVEQYERKKKGEYENIQRIVKRDKKGI